MTYRWPNTKITADTLAHEFNRRVDKTDGCWIWQGATTKRGYGQLGVNGTRQYAHRLAYELHCGSIPGGLEVCHRCDQPACVNPDHLFLGTHADNMADMANKGRGATSPRHGAAHAMAKLTDADVLEIRRRAATGEDQTAISNDFNVGRTTISMIHRRQIWRHLL